MIRKISVYLLLVSLASMTMLGQILQSEVTDEDIAQKERGILGGVTRPFWNDGFQAFSNGGIPGSSVVMEIEAIRSDSSQQATIRVSNKFPDDSLLTLTRIEYLAPEELAGDTFIIRKNEDDRREFDIFFWNPSLISPIKVEGQFEVFGDANVYEAMGLLVRGIEGKYFISDRAFLDEDPGVPAPEYTLEFRINNDDGSFRFVTVTKEAPLAEYSVEAIEARRESEPFPRIRAEAFINGFLNKLEFMDADGDLIHTHHYDWRNYEPFEYTDTNGTTTRIFNSTFIKEYMIENHIIPGNFTTIKIKGIEVKDFPLEFFDPLLLGE